MPSLQLSVVGEGVKTPLRMVLALLSERQMLLGYWREGSLAAFRVARCSTCWGLNRRSWERHCDQSCDTMSSPACVLRQGQT